MGSIPIFSTLRIKELQKSKSVTLFFLPDFCQKMEEKWGKGVEILGRNGDKFGFPTEKFNPVAVPVKKKHLHYGDPVPTGY